MFSAGPWSGVVVSYESLRLADWPAARRVLQPVVAMERAYRAVLFIDVVESVRLIEQDEEGFISRWLSIVDHIETEVVPRTGGRIVKRLGDGMLLEFADVRAAIAAAFAVQRASAEENTENAAGSQMMLRMGIEVSDVIVGRDDLYGRGVNTAARLMTLAGPGEIVVSANAREQLTPVLDADVEDLGQCYLRNLVDPVRAFRVGPPGPHPVIKVGRPLGELRPSLAIVPFTVRGGEGEQSVLGEVLAEEMIRSLCRSNELSVISQLSTTALRGRDLAIEEIGGLLHADYVVSGVCRISGDRIILDAELADAKIGRIVWSDRVADHIGGILSGDQHLIGQVVADVSRAIMTRELQRARSQPLPTLESYTLLVGAIALMHRLSAEDFNEARTLLETLAERSSHQPVVQSWLAKWHVLRVQQGWSTDVMEDARRALELTRRALNSDPELSLALAMDGFVHTNLLKRFDIARERYSLAIKYNPSNSLALLLKGVLHAFCDEGEQAVHDTELALTLSPLDPHRYFYNSLTASANITAGRYERALELAKRSLRANRTHTSTWRALTVAQWQLGMRQEACDSAQELMKLEPTLTIGGYLKRAPSASYAIGRTVADILKQAGVPE